MSNDESTPLVPGVKRKRVRFGVDGVRFELLASPASVDAWERAAKSLKMGRLEWARMVLDAAATPCSHQGSDLDLLPGPAVRLRCRRCGVVLEPRTLETGHGPE